MVTGGTGDLGRRLVSRLEAAGHQVLVGTRTPTEVGHVPFDLSDRPDPDSLGGVDVLVHLASDALAPESDVQGSARLWEAAKEAGVGHVLYMSIVGIDRHPFRYYQAKREVEALLEESGLPFTILRATQFHGLIPRFVDEIGRRLGVIPVSGGIEIQPIDPEVVADRLAELVEAGPSGRVPDMGGPEVLSLDDMVREYLRAAGRRILRFRVPLRGETVAAFRRGEHLAPRASAGGRTYRRYLEDLPRQGIDPLAPPLRVISFALLATMAWMLVSPSGFHSGIAGFGDPNAHFIRDAATFVLPLAVALWMSASRPFWRVPVLGLALAQNGLHIVDHVIDVNASDPPWHGPVNLAALVVLEVALWQILRLQRRHPRGRRA